MSWLTNLLMIAQVIAALGVIVLVLLQHGKGADMGAAFGSGASGSLFGATGSANFLSRTTGVLAALFFIATLALAFLGQKPAPVSGSVLDATPTQPAGASQGSAVPDAGQAVPKEGAPEGGAPKSGPASDIPK